MFSGLSCWASPGLSQEYLSGVGFFQTTVCPSYDTNKLIAIRMTLLEGRDPATPRDLVLASAIAGFTGGAIGGSIGDYPAIYFK